jgi:glyoxylase-like metal-dependent hydrolase (beta-lactamase superfamily II)
MTNSQIPPPWARCITAPNPGPITLDGTNSWVLGDDAVVVVDPGPLVEDHLLGLAMSGRVEQILLTHGHRDHSEGAHRLHELTGAPLRAWDPAWCHAADRLVDGEVLEVGGLSLRVLHTPGHTADSVSFVVSDARGRNALLTGDTILGSGTTVIAYPEGRLADYLSTLDRLIGLGDVQVLPGHGPVTDDAVTMATAYLVHRRERLEQVRAAVAAGASTASDVVDVVYAEVDTRVRDAALLTVQAQLVYLQNTGRGEQ